MTLDGLSAAQAAEIGKYAPIYRSSPNYRMSGPRGDACAAALAVVPWRGSYLDVSCGRGEMLAAADALGFGRVKGTEIAEPLIAGRIVRAPAWALPFDDDAFEVVSMFDVIEHLLPGDDERALRELGRVARCCVLVTANNLSSMHGGVELHVNRRPYPEWDAMFRRVFPAAKVTWLRERRAKKSEMWRIDLPEAQP